MEEPALSSASAVEGCADMDVVMSGDYEWPKYSESIRDGRGRGANTWFK